MELLSRIQLAFPAVINIRKNGTFVHNFSRPSVWLLVQVSDSAVQSPNPPAPVSGFQDPSLGARSLKPGTFF